MKLYIYLLFEIFVLETNYLLNVLVIICALIILTLSYDFILAVTFMECVLYLILLILIWFIILTILLLPYAVYIPGDNSYVKKFFINSKHLMHDIL